MGYRLQHLLHSSTEGFLLKLSLVFCLVLLPATLLAQWVKTNGPYGGYIYSLAARGDTLFAATNSGVFRSTDGGRYWLPVDRGLTRYDIRHLGLFEGMLYAATQKEPYRSSNYGESWEVMDSRLFSDTQLNDFAALGSSLFIVGSGEADGKCVGGLWRSSDQGRSWQWCLFSYLKNFYSLATYDSLLFAGSSSLYYSSDQGATWQEPNPSFGPGISSMVFLPSADSVGFEIFCSSFSEDVYRSTDLGTSWESVGPGKGRTLAVATDGTLYAGGYEGVSLSTDRGISWLKVDSTLPVKATRALVAIGDSLLYAGTVGGVYRSSDRGGVWLPSDSGLTGYGVKGVAASSDSFLFAGTLMGPLRSTNGGRSWSRVDFSVSSLTMFEREEGWVEAIAARDSTVLAGRIGTLLRSTDLGEHWMENPNLRFTLCLTAGDSGWYAGGDMVFSSFDRGLTWTYLEANLFPVGAIAADGEEVYAATGGSGYGHIFHSPDAGRTWTEITPPGLVYDRLTAMGAYRGTLILNGAFYGVLLSSDAGAHWKAASHGLPTPEIENLIFAKGAFFGSNPHGGVYRWDGAESLWTSVGTGLGDSSVASLTASEGRLYASMADGSIWYRPLSEITAVKESDRILPMRFSLEQNYPNPFNPATQINYTIGRGADYPEGTPIRGGTMGRGDYGGNVLVQLIVYDIIGRQVAILVNERKAPGSYTVAFDGTRLASGVYFYRLTAGGYIQSRKMILLK